MPKKIGWVGKPTFTFPGFGGGIDIHKVIGILPRPKAGFNSKQIQIHGPVQPP